MRTFFFPSCVALSHIRTIIQSQNSIRRSGGRGGIVIGKFPLGYRRYQVYLIFLFFETKEVRR